MPMSMEKVAKELENLGKYQSILGTILHLLEVNKVLPRKEITNEDKKRLIADIREVLPREVLDLVEQGVSSELNSYLDHSPHDPGDETD